MTFVELVKKTKYSPVYLGECILNKPNSRPTWQAKEYGYKVTEADIKIINKLKTSKCFREEFDKKISSAA
jgi:hypothetical protein